MSFERSLEHWTGLFSSPENLEILAKHTKVLERDSLYVLTCHWLGIVSFYLSIRLARARRTDHRRHSLGRHSLPDTFLHRWVLPTPMMTPYTAARTIQLSPRGSLSAYASKEPDRSGTEKGAKTFTRGELESDRWNVYQWRVC